MDWLHQKPWGFENTQWIAVAIIAVALVILLYYLSKNLPF